jgi:dihydroneopterin aldolase
MCHISDIEEIIMRSANESDTVCAIRYEEMVERAAKIVDQTPYFAQEAMLSQDVAEALKRLTRLRLQIKNLTEYKFIDSDKQCRISKAHRVLRPQLLSLETVLEGLL